MRKTAKENLLLSDREIKYKYITADGLSYPDGKCYALNSSKDQFPLWSYVSCGADKEFKNRPVYALEYPEEREVGRFIIIGDDKWQQGPLNYKLNLYVPQDRNMFAKYGDTVLSGDYKIIHGGEPEVSGPVDLQIGGNTVSCKKYSFEVSAENGADASRHCLKLQNMYPVVRAELEIIKWSAPKTTAKILCFTDDIKMVCKDDELQSISVLEEKTDGADELSYGITSNTCTVKLLNKDNRFIHTPELLKKNRIVKPSIMEEDDENWRDLGKFFSDSWEVSSTSDFVTCKAYDVLYNLQKMNLFYPMERVNGVYVMDGTENGVNGTAYEVFEKIFGLINKQRKASGIFGSDIVAKIDERLKEVTFEYVCLGFDTAWNMLQTMANAAQCFIYVDRDGNVRIVKDDFTGKPVFIGESETDSKEKVEISPSNSFSYNLPTMSHTIVNRVTVPYFTLEEIIFDETDKDKDKDEQFTIEEKDFEYDENGNVILNLSLKNFYKQIQEIRLCFDENFKAKEIISADKLTVSYNQIRIKLGKNISGTQYIKIVPKNQEKFKQVKAEKVYDDETSQKHNGIEEFELKSGEMIYGRDRAVEIGEKITERYGNGLPYIETEWRGTPELELGDTVESYSRMDTAHTYYECLSNDFNYDGGLKVKTKARAKKIAASE